MLLKLGRPIDVADCGLRFICSMGAILSALEAKGQARPIFKEVGTKGIGGREQGAGRWLEARNRAGIGQA